jgi:hypothetical protein
MHILQLVRWIEWEVFLCNRSFSIQQRVRHTIECRYQLVGFELIMMIACMSFHHHLLYDDIIIIGWPEKEILPFFSVGHWSTDKDVFFRFHHQFKKRNPWESVYNDFFFLFFLNWKREGDHYELKFYSLLRWSRR